MAKRRVEEKREPLDELRRLYEDCLRTNLKAGLEEGQMRKRIDSLLDGAANVVIAATLGVRKNRWGRDEWDIDNRHAPLLKELGQHALEAAKRAVPGFVEQLALKTVPKSMLKRLRAEYTQAYEREMELLLTQAAHAQARRDVKKLEAVMLAPKLDELEALALENAQENHIDLDAAEGA